LSDLEHKDKGKQLTLAVMERQMLEGFALCNAILNEERGLTPTTVIVMYTLIHNLHFYLMIKYIPRSKWPESVLLLGTQYGIDKT
jgi:hypothetical protein